MLKIINNNNTTITRPKLLRQITSVEDILGISLFDDIIKENNKINKVKSGDKGYIPTSKSFLLLNKTPF